MYAYLVDPFLRRIAAAEYRGDQRQVHCYLDAMHIDLMRLNQAGDGMYIDDDGFAKDPPRQAYFFYWKDGEGIGAVPHVVAGKALVVGPVINGVPVTPAIDAAELTRRIVWVDAAHAMATVSRALRGDTGQTLSDAAHRLLQ